MQILKEERVKLHPELTGTTAINYLTRMLHMKSLVPKRYISIFVYSRKMQSKGNALEFF
jgi:hypothetical protein